VKAFGSTFKPAPAGLHRAVCVDVHDLGMVQVTFQGRTSTAHKVDVYWVIEAVNPDNGKPFLTRKRYTLSLDAKANLRKDLESWRSKPFSDKDLSEGFDLEVLIGVNCQIMVQHAVKDGSTYANVTTVVPAARGEAKLAVPADYVRKALREPPKPVEPVREADDEGPTDVPEFDVSDIPFSWLLPLVGVLWQGTAFFS